MAAPVAAYIQLPTDSSNTGKKNRTQTKVVGSDTVHEHFQVPTHSYTRAGRYSYQSALQTVASSSQTGTGSGLAWFELAAASSGYVASIKKISVSVGTNTTVNVASRGTQLSFTKYTYTGTQSTGTPFTALNWGNSTNPLTQICSTSSGATITLVQDLATYIIPAAMTTVGAYGGSGWVDVYQAAEPYHRNSAVEFTTAQGLVVYQSGAGVASDVRTFVYRVEWEEIDAN